MVKLSCGDCLELMKDIPDGSVDLILTDLPYGVTRCYWDIPIPFEPMWKEFHRVTKLNAAIVLHCMQPFTSKLISSNLKEFKYTWIWYKHYTRGFLLARRQPLRTCEDIAVFYRKQCTYNPEMRRGKMMKKSHSSKQNGCYKEYKALHVVNDLYYPTQILDFKGVPSNHLNHPTEKPVPLLEYLIRTYTDPGETVLDCCMGSGSTGVAAVNQDRNYIGIELEKSFFDIARARIEAAEKEKGKTA